MLPAKSSGLPPGGECGYRSPRQGSFIPEVSHVSLSLRTLSISFLHACFLVLFLSAYSSDKPGVDTFQLLWPRGTGHTELRFVASVLGPPGSESRRPDDWQRPWSSAQRASRKQGGRCPGPQHDPPHPTFLQPARKAFQVLFRPMQRTKQLKPVFNVLHVNVDLHNRC